MGLKQSKRSFEVTTGSPKKDAAPAEPKAELIENKEPAVAPTNGDVKPAEHTNGEEKTDECKQNGGGGDAEVKEENGKAEENGKEETEKKEEKKEKVKKKRSFRSFSFLRREKKHKEVKEAKDKNGDAKVEAEVPAEEKPAEEAPAAPAAAKESAEAKPATEESAAAPEEAKEGDAAPAAEVTK